MVQEDFLALNKNLSTTACKTTFGVLELQDTDRSSCKSRIGEALTDINDKKQIVTIANNFFTND
eukprot:3317996-Amphidinium_carterae.1